MSEEERRQAEEYNERARERESAGGSEKTREEGSQSAWDGSADKREGSRSGRRSSDGKKVSRSELLRIVLPVGGVLLAAVLCLVLVCSSIQSVLNTLGSGVQSTDGSWSGDSGLPSQTVPNQAENEAGPNDSGLLPDEGTQDQADEEKMTVSEVAETCMPAMVSVTAEDTSDAEQFYGSYSSAMVGSGVIFERRTDGLIIVTNNHVVSGYQTLLISFCDDSEAQATLVGADATEDIAVLSVDRADIADETWQAITAMRLGDYSECVIGEQVVAIGNALGYGQSVSAGIISALDRNFTIDNVTHKLIQTDAAINPGNSGGALLNMKGELIGINEVKYAKTTVEGMGFAIPISVISPIVDNILDRETREKVDESERSYLGISCFSMPEEYVSSGYPEGVYVSEVTEGFAAEAAGIEKGDIISAIENHTITSADDLIDELEYYKAGETVNLTVLRLNDDQTAFDTFSIDVTLSARADMPQTDSSDQAEESEGTEDSQSAGEDPAEDSNMFTMPYGY